MKDPAFLFYTSDFLTGTMLMSDEQVGKYVRLLCLQHQRERLSEKDMLKICKTYDDDIFSKFKQDERGFYNERLEEESIKRKKYSESRRKNRIICKTYDEHMENENININIDNKKGGMGGNFKPPTLEEITAYCQSRKNNINPKAFFDYFMESGWIDSNGNPVKSWKSKLITWENLSKNKGSPKKTDYAQRTYTAEHFEKDREESIREMEDWYNAQEKDKNGDAI